MTLLTRRRAYLRQQDSTPCMCSCHALIFASMCSRVYCHYLYLYPMVHIRTFSSVYAKWSAHPVLLPLHRMSLVGACGGTALCLLRSYNSISSVLFVDHISHPFISSSSMLLCCGAGDPYPAASDCVASRYPQRPCYNYDGKTPTNPAWAPRMIPSGAPVGGYMPTVTIQPGQSALLKLEGYDADLEDVSLTSR